MAAAVVVSAVQEVVVLVDLKEIMVEITKPTLLDMVQVAVVVLVVSVIMVQLLRVVMVVLEHRFQQPSEIQVTLQLETLGD